jgi:polyisoprenoid-binding protein YceI
MTKRPAEAFVYTFKEGLLSAVAHDLKIRVERVELEVDGETAVRATFDAGSLRVVTTRRDGADAPGLLPTMLYGEIEKNIRNDVLKPAKFPQVKFESTSVTPGEVLGRLTLCGVTREIRCKREGDRVEARLDVRDFGIKPYSAMLGTLKVKPEVVVEVRAL